MFFERIIQTEHTISTINAEQLERTTLGMQVKLYILS